MAGKVIDEEGIDRLSLDDIAHRAGTSVGSVYRFVANRDELVTLVAAAVGEAALDAMEGIHTAEEAKLSAETIAADTVERFLAFIGSHPGSRGLLLDAGRLPPAAQAALGASEEWLTRVEHFLGFYAPHLSPERRRHAALLIITTTGAALATAPVWATGTRGPALAELELMISSYLRALSSPPP